MVILSGLSIVPGLANTRSVLFEFNIFEYSFLLIFCYGFYCTYCCSFI